MLRTAAETQGDKGLPTYGSGFLVGKQSFSYRIPKRSLGTSVSSGL